MYYNFKRLINLKDADGLTPSVFIVTNNRTSGKTTGFLELFLRDYFEKQREFILIFRTVAETESADKLFGDVLEIYFPEITDIEIHKEAKGIYCSINIKVDGEFQVCGYALSLKNRSKLKRYSPVFRKVYNLALDEYQEEDDNYLPDEIGKLESILITVSRGGGEYSRYTRLFLLGNPFTPFNPYYAKYGIHERLKENTRILRGKGWVADFSINKEASEKLAESTHAKAFNSKYTQHAIRGSYMKSNDGMIIKKRGRYIPLYSFEVNGDFFTVERSSSSFYVSKGVNYEVSLMTRDPLRADQYTMFMPAKSPMYKKLKSMFDANLIFYDSMTSKENFFKFLFNIT